MRTSLLVACCVALAACEGRLVTTGSIPTLAQSGTYTLRTVNGLPLPFETFRSSTMRKEITADTLVLLNGGEARDVIYERTTNLPSDTLTTFTAGSGRYTITGTRIDLPYFGFSSGTISGSTLTFVTGEDTWIYQK